MCIPKITEIIIKLTPSSGKYSYEAGPPFGISDRVFLGPTFWREEARAVRLTRLLLTGNYFLSREQGGAVYVSGRTAR